MGGGVGGRVGGWLDYAKLKLTSAPNMSWVGTGAELCKKHIEASVAKRLNLRYKVRYGVDLC